MAVIFSFPSSRMPPVVRVERERDGDGWIVLRDAVGESYGDFKTALIEARKIAAGENLTIWSSAGRVVP
jgi:hypothetical protein